MDEEGIDGEADAGEEEDTDGEGGHGLDLDVDDLLHPEESGEHGEAGEPQRDLTTQVVEQDPDVPGVRDVEHHRETGWQTAEDDRAHPAFSGEGLDVPAEPLALDHRDRHRLEQVGQVATDLAL